MQLEVLKEKNLQAMLKELRSKEIRHSNVHWRQRSAQQHKKSRLAPPHDHKHTLGHFHKSDKTHVTQAIDAALAAKEKWANLSWEHRAVYF
jgi:1-pyrroline-5-carboxylate dehydrogenase